MCFTPEVNATLISLEAHIAAVQAQNGTDVVSRAVGLAYDSWQLGPGDGRYEDPMISQHH